MLDTSGIKNIIFDLGGVILNLNFNNTAEHFKSLGIRNFDEIYSKYKQLSLFDDFEVGKISPSDFIKKLKTFAPENCLESDIETAWNAMLLDLPKERIELLQKLKIKYRLFLLSNTNEIHYNAFMQQILESFGRPVFSEIFEKEYYSHILGKRKPHKETFEFVMNEQNLLPEETLFLDDTLHHIEGAKVVGINTKLVTKEEGILELFQIQIS